MCVLLALLASITVVTASEEANHDHIYVDLEYLLLIWGGVYLSNLLAHWTKLTNILFHIAFGCICVNAKILPEAPGEFLATLSELAITIIMFSLGLEEDVRNFMIGIKKAWGIALIGALGPFCVGYVSILIFFDDQKMALMSGLCLTATAVSLTMVTLKGFGLSKSKASIGVMTSAVLDDIGSLALVAIMVPLLTSDDGVSAVDIIIILCKAGGFFALVAVICKFVFPERIRMNFCCMPDTFCKKWGLRHLMMVDRHQSTLLILMIGLGFGMLAHILGFHPGIGAYMGALIIKKAYFLDYHDKEPDELGLAHRAKQNLQQDADGFEAVSHAIDNIAMSWMGPIFFVILGTKLKIEADVLKETILQICILYFFMVVIQFLSAGLAARYVPGGFNFVESVMIGLGMLGRAELAFVVLDIAYVQNDILNLKCFYVMMFTCFMLNMTVPLVLAWWRPYYMGEKHLSCFQDGPEYGGMGEDGPEGTEVHISSRGRTVLRHASKVEVHSFRFMVAQNGAIIAASDKAVRFWGFRHEQDIVGVHRLNGRFPDDPNIKGLDVASAEFQLEEWPENGEKTIDVRAADASEKILEFAALIRRMPVQGSVFQDNNTLRNHTWFYSVHMQDEIACNTPGNSPPMTPAPHGIIVEMEELRLNADGSAKSWDETARFRKGLEEDVREGPDGRDFDKGHLGTISVHSLLDVMEWLKQGVAIFDTPAKTIQELCDELENELIDQTVVNEEQAKEVVNTMMLHHNHAIEKKAENVKRTGRDEALHRCGCDVLVGAVKFLKRPVAAFIRLDEPRTLGEMTTEGHFPTKFIFLCLGPIGQDVEEFHEVGRAFSCLMSNKGFLDMVSSAPSKLVVCEAVHTFLAQSDIIPQFHHVRYGIGADKPAGPVADSDSDSDSDEKVDHSIVLSKRGTNEEIMRLEAHTDAFSPRHKGDRRLSEDILLQHQSHEVDTSPNPLQTKPDDKPDSETGIQANADESEKGPSVSIVIDEGQN